MSYVLPYVLVGLSGGLTLSLATDKYIFTPICVLTAIGLGMIRNNNVKNNDEKSQFLNKMTSFGLKVWAMYIFGPSILFLGSFVILAITIK